MSRRNQFHRRQLLTLGFWLPRRKAASRDVGNDKTAAASPSSPASIDIWAIFGPRVPFTWRSATLVAGVSGIFLVAALQMSTLLLLAMMLVAAFFSCFTAGSRPVAVQPSNRCDISLESEVLLRLRGGAAGIVVGGCVGLAACVTWLNANLGAFGFVLPLQIATTCGLALGLLLPRLVAFPAMLVCLMLDMFL